MNGTNEQQRLGSAGNPMKIVRIALAGALLAATAATLAGLSAPFLPTADIINHFRPFILLAAAALVAAAMAIGARRLTWASLALAAGNAVLLALPLVWSAEPAERSTAGQA